MRYMLMALIGPKLRESSRVRGLWSERTKSLPEGIFHSPSGADHPLAHRSRPVCPSIKTCPVSILITSPPNPKTRLTSQNPDRKGCVNATTLPRRKGLPAVTRHPMNRSPSCRAGAMDEPETRNDRSPNVLISRYSGENRICFPSDRR